MVIVSVDDGFCQSFTEIGMYRLPEVSVLNPPPFDDEKFR